MLKEKLIEALSKKGERAATKFLVTAQVPPKKNRLTTDA
jgi:hypothetical protein